MPFPDYSGTKFVPYLLPIIPADATLSPRSNLTPEKLGKIPGRRRDDGWVGYDWQNSHITENRLIGLASMYQGGTQTIGIQAKRFPGLDLDLNYRPLVEGIREIAYEEMGETISRGRANSPRVIMMYRADERAPQLMRKMRHVYQNAAGEKQAIEWLANDQQYLIEGNHPSGVPYQWEMWLTPLAYGCENLPIVTPDQVERFFEKADRAMAFAGWTHVRGGDMMRMGSAFGAPPREVGPDHPDLCPDLDMLKDVLENYLPVDHAEFVEYGDWAAMLIAIATACGKDEQFYDDVFLPWCTANPDNEESVVREKWDSVRQSSIGWSYITNIAHGYGYSADVQALFGNLDEDGVPSSGAPGPPQGRTRSHGPVPKLMPPDFALHKIPKRPYVLGHRFMAGVVTLGVGAPGAGKSNLAILTALSIATGQPLTGELVHRSGRVWVHNNEDSLDELYRRIGGMLQCHQIGYDSVRENIFVTSGLDERLVVAVKEKDIVRRTAAVADVIASIKEQGIVHIVIDPLISTHRGVSENSNDEIEQVIETIQHIAHETECSIDLVHHALKSHSHNTEVHAGDMNAARGASSLIGAARMVYTLSSMSKVTAEKLQLPAAQAARLVRLDIGKGNYAARDTNIRWFELEPFDIGNGDSGEIFCESDSIAVPKPWAQATAHAQPASKADERAVARATMLQRVRDVVAGVMLSERCAISKVRASIKREFGVAKTTADNRIKEAIPEGPEGEEVTAEGGGCSYVLTMERQMPSPPGRLYIARKPSEQYSEAA